MMRHKNKWVKAAKNTASAHTFILTRPLRNPSFPCYYISVLGCTVLSFPLTKGIHLLSTRLLLAVGGFTYVRVRYTSIRRMGRWEVSSKH